MFYMTVKLITVVLIYKIIKIGPFSASASTLVMPLWFILGDIIAEVYGYKVTRHILWIAILCQFVFAVVCTGLIKLDSPPQWVHQDAYEQVLGNLPRVVVASFLAIISGSFINAYALSKWKILLNGKHFWLRSFGASSIGELVFAIVAYLTEFAGIAIPKDIIQLIVISYAIKLLLNPLLAIPSVFLTTKLKKLEHVDTFDYKTNFNPFRLSLEDNDSHHHETDLIKSTLKNHN